MSTSIPLVLITGATGFIGSRLCEVMSFLGGFQPRAFIHSTASAARIARLPLEFVTGDLCDRASVEKAIQGCSAVVHLARGDKQVMRNGLENVLRAAAKHHVSRFVHVSSVAVYGNSPPPGSVSESAPAKRTDNAYGNEKLEQELLVLRYSRTCSLPTVILRPPNVYGPYSTFTLGLVGKLRSGKLALVDGGQNPCNLVYVDNLVQALLLSIWKKDAVSEIFFVTDAETITWERSLQDMAHALGLSLPRVERQELAQEPKKHVLRESLRVLPRVLLSGEMRSVVRQVPLIHSMENSLYRAFQALSPETQEGIRLRINGPPRLHQKGETPSRFDAADNVIAAQNRRVAHSSAKARRLLGYTAPISYQQGMCLTEAWMRSARIL